MIDDEFDELAESYLLAREHGEAAALERLCDQHPRYAERLLQFALIDAAISGEPSETELAAVRPMLTTELKALTRAAIFESPSAVLNQAGLIAHAAALGMDARRLAVRTNLPRDLLLALDQRAVAAATVPLRCYQTLAEALQVTVGAVQVFLGGNPAIQATGRAVKSAAQPLLEPFADMRPAQAPAFSYAPAAPGVARKQTFAEALAHSALATDEQRAFWQSFLHDEEAAE